MASHDYTLFKRKGSKVWYFYYRVGAERKSATTGKKLKFEAEAYADSFVKQLRGEEKHVPTLGEILQPYFTGDDCPRQKTLRINNRVMGVEHQKHQRSSLKRLIFPHPICQKKKTDLKRSDFRDLINDLLKEYSVSAVNNAIKALKTALQEEFDSGNLAVNYLARMGNISKEEQEPGTFTTEEGELIFYTKDVELFPTTRERMACLIAYEAALRRGEIFALKWKHRNQPDKMLNVKEAWKNFYTKEKGLPKWGKLRDVPMSKRLEEELDRYYESVLTCRDEDYIICWDDGSPISPKTWQTWFVNVCKKLGEYLKKQSEGKKEADKKSFDRKARNIKPHGFRHTRISLWKMAGIPDDLIQLWAGHSEKKTTKRYTHYSNEFMVEQLRKKT